MKYLKKATVKTVIDLAHACPPDRDFTAEEIRAGIQGQLAVNPHVRAFNAFLVNLSEDERAELTALLWLGRGYEHSPEDFEELVQKTWRSQSRDLFEESKQKLPQALRLGMERLARRKTGKRNAGPNDDEKRRQLVGRFVIESYLETYGDKGWGRLIQMMEERGYLDRAEDRKLFGLNEDKYADELSTVLSGKRASGKLRIAPIRTG